jgi:hypothetical protein
MTSASLDEGDVLWIDPAVYHVPERPGGFAFLVQNFLGWGDPGRAVWVRGLLLDGRGTPVRSLTLCVPASQPRAVPASRVPAPRVPAHTPPTDTGGVAAPENAGHRARDNIRDDPRLVGPPPGYRRRAFR